MKTKNLQPSPPVLRKHQSN